jgi:transcriptional regulator with XRE-family HTH domain
MGTMLKKNGTHVRVKRLRLALGFTQQQDMADKLGISFNRWNNVERGLTLGIDLAKLICRKFPGVTLDWLYFGHEAGLTQAMKDKLDQVPNGPKKS